MGDEEGVVRRLKGVETGEEGETDLYLRTQGLGRMDDQLARSGWLEECSEMTSWEDDLPALKRRSESSVLISLIVAHGVFSWSSSLPSSSSWSLPLSS